MALLNDIRINGQDASLNPVVAGLNPVINWVFDEDAESPSQVCYEIRIGTNQTNLGFDSFNGNIKSEIIESSANTYEHKDHSLIRGKLYYCQLRVKNNEGNFTPWSTFNFQINQLPFISNYYISPSSPSPNQDLELFYTYHDLDNHAEFGTKIRWFKNNLIQSSYNDMCILPSTAISSRESWSAKIIPSDGLEFGPVAETQSVTISEPDISFSNITIKPADANIDDILKVEYNLDQNEYTDLSNTIEYEWYINDEIVENSNQQYIRLDLNAGDSVSVVIRVKDGDTTIAENRSLNKIILDVPWIVYDIEISGQSDTSNVVDLEPVVEWKIHKTKSEPNQLPSYLRILITKTPSLDGPIYDTGFTQYLKPSYKIPSGILGRGQKYFVHVVAGDSNDINENLYFTKEIQTAGSSWSMNVDNKIGWTIETRLELESSEDTSNLGIYVHDGTYFCSVLFGLRSIKFQSSSLVEYEYSDVMSDLTSPKTFRISAKEKDIKIFIDNQLVIDGNGVLDNPSKMKFIEYGDIDGKNSNTGTFRFLRYSTKGAYGLDTSLSDANSFYFSEIGNLPGGEIEYVFENLVSWLPNDSNESAKLIEFNENSNTVRLSTCNRNYSPITSIYINEKRNKYIGTANGVTGIFGDKHDPDYSLDLSGSVILPKDFDRVSTIPKSYLNVAEYISNGWLNIDTTYRSVPPIEIISTNNEDEYNPYLTTQKSHAIHYYSQRTFGHPWFDRVDNTKGWSVAFSADIEKIEADDFIDENVDKHGFGVYINDGTYQEIIYFYEDRIRLFYANVYININTKIERKYYIVGKENNIFIYQKPLNDPTPFFLVLDGSGLFNTPAVSTGNSRKPKTVLDSQGIYHAVWHDDSTKRSQIFYSYFSGNEWSHPELVTETNQFNLRNADIDIDNLGRAWVVYEDTSWGPTEISVSVRDNAGWNPRTRLTNNSSNKGSPAIKIDEDQNVHVVWEDNRNGNFNIFWAEWQNETQSWVSSAQFGTDTPVMQFDSNDPYFSDEYGINTASFKNARLALLNEKLWIVCEVQFINDNKSAIYRGFRNLTTRTWISPGSSILDEDGNFSSSGSGFITSPSGRNCVNPCIATNNIQGMMVVAWEDQTEPISQIWGSAINQFNSVIVEAERITNQNSDCSKPCVCWLNSNAVILFKKNRGLYLSYFNGNFQSFFGSANGGEDRLITISDSKTIDNPSVTSFVPSTAFRVVYDFIKDRNPEVISSIESPEFYAIGDALIEHEGNSQSTAITTTTTINELDISNSDTKEFAIGDFSENVGMIAKWKDISMYFAYDAKPYNISIFNSNTIENWPDNRVNDVFIDVFGNIIAATFGGLLYYNIFNGQITNIDGQTESFDSTVGCTSETCLLKNKLITSVKWGKNGIWYVGTTSGIFYSKTAGKTWNKLFSETLGNKIVTDIAVDQDGRAVIAAYETQTASNDGIFVAHPDMSAPINIVTPNQKIKTIAVDENNIIWAGSDTGLFRIENFNSFMSFGKNQGMRSSHVNDITIVNKHLRYIATATGIERMYGTKFTNFNVHTSGLLSDNISVVEWYEKTQSLWVGALYSLHEIVFKDPVHDIIENEIVQYSSDQISTSSLFDKNVYSVLDFDEFASDTVFSSDTASVFINKNKVDFGYLVNETGQSVSFLCDLMPNDQIEVELSNRFMLYHDFNQTELEKEVLGEKRTSIGKIDRTSRNQLLLLSTLDKPAILLDGGITRLPFTTIMIDREAPVGCIEKLDTISRTVLKFKIFASDKNSGIDGMILSNYENFTSDGETPLNYQPFQSVIEHDVGNDLTSVITSLELGETVSINGQDYTSGTGNALGTWFDTTLNKSYLYAGTKKPSVIYRYDPVTDEWTAIAALDSLDENRSINQIKNINNVLWVLTGSDSSGANGGIYKSVDGINFSLVGSVTGSHARGIAASAEGTVFFGSSDGKIYSYKDSILSVKYQNIGQSVYSLSLFGNTLLAATGTNGRIFSIDLNTDNDLIVFDGSESFIREVFVKDSEVITSIDQAILYASSGELTTIYKTPLSDLSFSKSFNSTGNSVNKITSVDAISLVDPSEKSGVSGTQVVAAIGNSLFKNVNPGWEFVYKNSEEIKDIIQFFSNGVYGVWLISDSKVTKWTAIKNTKTIFLRLKDKAGNVSRQPEIGDAYLCPTDTNSVCCNYAYSINIQDLQGFINESRILDISEYGEIRYTYDSPNDMSFFSATQITEEIGIYTSDIFNGSNELVSWKSITWTSVEPEGTSVSVQIRSSVTEDGIEDEDWSSDLEKNANDIVSLEHITDQYIQFRVILKSSTRDISPSLEAVVLRNITAQASHFFTTNFVLPSRPIKGLLTANTFIPISADIVFGISTKNSVNFGDYQVIEPNRLFTTEQGQFGSNLRIGAKLLSPNIPQISPTNNPGDPYDESSYICTVSFVYENINSFDTNYHFRIKFYNDLFRTQLVYTFFTGNDQTGWKISSNNEFPATGLFISALSSATIYFTPNDLVETNQKWYITIEAYDGANFESISDNKSFACASCSIKNESGLLAQYYGGFSSLEGLPNFNDFVPEYSLIDSDINFQPILTAWTTTDGTILNENYVNRFAVKWRGKLLVPSTGEYQFKLVSDDGSLLMIDSDEVINFDGVHTETEKTGSVNLEQGFHDIDVQYFANLGPAYCQLQWIIPGESIFSPIPSSNYFHAVANEYCEGTEPQILNLAMIFEMENGENIKINLNE